MLPKLEAYLELPQTTIMRIFCKNSWGLKQIIHLVRTKIFWKTKISCPLIPTLPFLYQLETSEKLSFSDVVRGCRNESVCKQGVRNVSFSENFAYVLIECLQSGSTIFEKTPLQMFYMALNKPLGVVLINDCSECNARIFKGKYLPKSFLS